MEGAVCKLCAADGRKTILRLFQINLEEAIWMCPSKECTFPFGAMTIDNILVKRNVSEIPDMKRRKVKVKRSRPANTTPQLAYSAVTSTTNQAAMVTDKKSSRLYSSRSSMQVAESKLPVVVGVPDVNTSQKHTSYVTDRRHRTDSASPSTPDSSRLTVLVPSPTEAVFSPNTNTDSAALPVPTSSSPGHCIAKAGHTSAVYQNPGLVSLLTKQVKPFLDSTIIRPRRYLQWSNVDALCWMDVALCLLVHCTNLKEQVATSGGVETSLVRRLLVRYKEILASWDSVDLSIGANVETKRLSLETSVGRVPVKTGGGGLDHLVMPPGAYSGCSASEKNTSPVYQCDMKPRRHESGVSLETVCRMLADVRDNVLACQPKLLCERGHNHSPVFALPLLLGNDDQVVHDHFRVEYCWRMTCTRCHHCHEDRVAKTVPTFPAVPNDFSMNQPCFLRACFKCCSPGQRMNMHIERMPSTLLIHFVEGLFDPQLTNHDFQFGAETYAVTGLIQYKTTPDHFIAWIRDVRTNHWMVCDDLRNPVCQFSERTPCFPPSQVHIVMWERQGHCGNPIAMETVTNFLIATRDTVPTAPTDRLTCISTQTTTVPPGDTVLVAPVVLTPALVTTNTSGAPQHPLPATPQGLAVPVVTDSCVVRSDARTKTGTRTDRLQRCREKFERAKAIRQRAATPALTPAPPTVICVPNLQGGQLHAMSRAAPLSAQSVVSQSAVTMQSGHCDRQLSLRTQVSSSHKPRGTFMVTSNGVKSGVRVIRSVPVFAGYTAKALGRKHDVNGLNATQTGANSSGETNCGVNTSSLKCGVNTSSSLKCGVNTSSSTNSGVNTSSSINSGANTSSSANGGASSSTSLNGGVNTSSSANSGVNISSSTNSGLSMPPSANSSVACSNTAASKKRVIVRQSGGSGKRCRVSALPTPPVVSTRIIKCVTSSEPETVSCSPTQSCEESEHGMKQINIPNCSDKLAGVLDELCSLDMSDVSQSVSDCDDVIDFHSLLAL